jgi:hypothetical protein
VVRQAEQANRQAEKAVGQAEKLNRQAEKAVRQAEKANKQAEKPVGTRELGCYGGGFFTVEGGRCKRVEDFVIKC